MDMPNKLMHCTSTEDQNSFNKNIMKIAENLANYSTTNQLPNSDPVKII